MSTTTTALTQNEKQQLEKHESTISRGLCTFFEVGAALLAIREGRLYREAYGTFENYCQRRWDFSRVRAHQLIDAAETRTLLTGVNKDVPLPSNEAQTRPLVSVPEDDLSKVWDQVVSTAPRDDTGQPKISSRHVKSVVDAYHGDEGKPSNGARNVEKQCANSIDLKDYIHRHNDMFESVHDMLDKISADAWRCLDDECPGVTTRFVNAVTALSAISVKVFNMCASSEPADTPKPKRATKNRVVKKTVTKKRGTKKKAVKKKGKAGC